jgi:hypothetical protein
MQQMVAQQGLQEMLKVEEQLPQQDIWVVADLVVVQISHQQLSLA